MSKSVPKNFLRSLAIAAVFTGGFMATDIVTEPKAVYASSMVTIDGYQYTQEVAESLKIINAERKAMGLSEFKLDPKLTKSAESHAKYLATNVKGASHEQKAGKPGFTGVKKEDRAIAAGYKPTAMGESVYYSSKPDYKKAVEETFEGVHHRTIFTQRSMDKIGIGIYGGAFVYVTDDSDGKSIDRKLVSYPYNGQVNAPTTFDIKETPNPLAPYGVSKSGYIISASPSGDVISWESVKIVVKDSKGNIVPLLNKDSEADITNAGDAYYVIPKNDLKNGEKYTATITYTDWSDEKLHSESWSFTTVKSGSTTVTPTPAPSTPSTPDIYATYKARFADFDEKAWWASDMIWAVDRGLINGYGNVWNSKTKKYETQLQPNTQLTEAHFLTIFFRYAEKDKLASTAKPTSWTHSAIYKIASEKKMPVLANESSAWSKGLADKGIRRGKLAQLMASYYYGKSVSESTAIDFLIKNKITTAKTVAEYNANQILTRSQISAFIQRYDAFVASQK